MTENNETKIADEIMDLMPSDDNSKSIIKTLLENQIKAEKDPSIDKNGRIIKYDFMLPNK
jgi:hypothetical protein